MNTRSKIAVLGMVALSFAFSGNATAQTMKEKTVMVGGAPMYPSKNIIENAVNSKDHKTLVAAVKAAGLVETLQEQDLSQYLHLQMQPLQNFQKEQ
jgi:uncharacterized surface protein with fasciclin (FAS1) repeats